MVVVVEVDTAAFDLDSDCLGTIDRLELDKPAVVVSDNLWKLKKQSKN